MTIPFGAVDHDWMPTKKHLIIPIVQTELEKRAIQQLVIPTLETAELWLTYDYAEKQYIIQRRVGVYHVPTEIAIVYLDNYASSLTASVPAEMDAYKIFNIMDYAGVDPTGGVDCTAQFRQMYADACALSTSLGRIRWVEVYIPTGKYNVSGGDILINEWSIRTRCAGTLIFNPTTSRRVFKVQAPLSTNIMAYVQFYGLRMEGYGTQQKIAIDAWDFTGLIIDDLIIVDWTGNGGNSANPSTGLWTHGREFMDAGNMRIFADRPVYFDVNPNEASICTDHFHLHDNYFATLQTDLHAISSAPGVVHSNLTIDSENSMVLGKGAVKFPDGSASMSFNVTLENIRYEQAADTTGFAVEILMPILGVAVRNSGLGGSNVASNGGIKLRKVNCFTADTVNYLGSAGNVAMDVDGSCDAIQLTGVTFLAGSVMHMTGLTELMSMPKVDEGSPVGPSSYWKNSSTGGPAALTLCGTKTDYTTLLLLGVGQASSPLVMGTGGVPLKVATLTVSGSSADGSIHESGVVSCNATGAKLVSGTTGFAVGNTFTKLCVYSAGSASVLIINNTASPLNIVVSAVWVR